MCSSDLTREEGLVARFLLAGWLDSEHPGAIPQAVITGWHAEGWIEYLGHRSDMVSLLKQCTLVVLPSRYREGVPQILIEAASIGRPMVATDVPGCREVCVDGVNGKLIEPGDAKQLADAIRDLVVNRGKAEEMGRRGRQLAETVFDVPHVVSATLQVYAAATLGLARAIPLVAKDDLQQGVGA